MGVRAVPGCGCAVAERTVPGAPQGRPTPARQHRVPYGYALTGSAGAPLRATTRLVFAAAHG
ncbi:hypothetical protein J2Z21_004157 [Streptomyces griseochromogenes]|uniref:Uncharacterized protein n=1 Tax=Streptomyces griseochromogenes TaxID=68214 RepID=A0ABS4LUW0_9ACTN|nr:hypothetical protein [Streptomyces griseochromogenes]